MKAVSETRAFGGVQGVYAHQSVATGCTMTFGLYLPPQAQDGPVPCLWYLSGLTCTHENAMLKAGAQAHAAEHGIAVVFPDTSPRGEGVADDPDIDLGQGAGFYVDATQAPWAPNFAMRSYVADELQRLVTGAFPIDEERQGITGHSMGGHGALTLAMAFPDLYRSVSAFAPIAHPSASDWGRKQLSAYLGPDESLWQAHDAAALVRQGRLTQEVLIDQGCVDPFLDKLMPEALSEALTRARCPHLMRMQPGYDHSYFFVASFMADHLDWHGERL